MPSLVDMVHACKGVVVEQIEKRVEKHLIDSILLWRLLKLLFKFLQRKSEGKIAIPPLWNQNFSKTRPFENTKGSPYNIFGTVR